MKYRSLCLTALFAALICLLSPLSVPIGAVPISLASFGVYITSVCLGKKGAFSVLIYVLLGAVGLPVFSGFRGGIDAITGLTGGYILGYILCAWIVGFARDKWKSGRAALLIAMLVGTAALYAVGTLQYMRLSGNPLLASLTACVLPFLPGDAVKILAALLLSVRIRNLRIFQP